MSPNIFIFSLARLGRRKADNLHEIIAPGREIHAPLLHDRSNDRHTAACMETPHEYIRTCTYMGPLALQRKTLAAVHRNHRC
jgi:hypothetical protein